MSRASAVALSRASAAALIGLVLLGAVPPGARAQAQPPTPGTVLDTVPSPKPAPAAPPQLLFPREPEPAADRGGPRFVVYGFEFVGNTVFSQARLRRLVERYVDLELNLFELNRAADTVTRFYRDQGYPIARAIVPAQRVEDGLVRIEVVEGRIGRVAFEGNRRYGEAFLAARAAPLAQGGVVTVGALERSLLLLNDLPGVSARATLEPGREFGTTDALVSIDEKPFDAQLQVANTGRREVGSIRFDAGGNLNNPLGIGDQLSARLIRSQQGLFEYRRLGYSLPLAANGLRLSAAASHVDYRVAGEFEALGIRGTVRGTEIGLSYPWTRSRTRNVALSAGQRRVETQQSALGVPVSNSTLTVFTAGVNASWVHADSSASTLSLGFTGNGKDNVGPAARPDALRARYDADYTYLTGVSPRWDFFFRGQLVQTAGAAPDTEKFGLGGPDSVRAYRSAELRGDDGWLTQLEMRRQFAVADMVAVGALFYDWGGVRNRGFAGQDKLQGVGAGVTVFPARNLRAQVQVATPFQSRVPADHKGGTRLWFSLAAQF